MSSKLKIKTDGKQVIVPSDGRPAQTKSKQEVGNSSMDEVEDSFSTVPDDGAAGHRQPGAQAILKDKQQPNKSQSRQEGQRDTLQLSQQGLYDRNDTKLDIKAIKQINQTTTAELNKKMFIDDYGIKFEIPSLYVQDSKFFKKQPEYSVQLINYVAPKESKMQIQRHDETKQTEIVNISEILDEEQKGGAVLRLVKIQDQQQETCSQCILSNATSTLMKFSDAGDMFAYYDIDNQTVRIVSIEGQITELINKISKQKFQTNFMAKSESCDISFIKSIEFDTHSQYFIGYGDHKVFILNLKTKEKILYDLNREIYDKIYTIRFVSSTSSDPKGQKPFKCILGCSRLGSKQICFFDAQEYMTGNHNHFEKEEGHEHHEIITLSYFNELSKDALVQISTDLNEMVLTNGKENYILERHDKKDKRGEVTQRNLNQLKNKRVMYIKCDQYGFFFVASRDYDSMLDVQHSHRPDDFEVNFTRQIEPGIIKIFDFNITSAKTSTGVTTNKYENRIRMLSLRDDEFLIDEAIYKEDITKELSNWIKGSNEYTYKQHSPEYFTYVNNAIRAFGFNWPYFSFSGLGNDIIVINCYDHKQIHQVQLGEKKDKMNIVDTYITDTNDLFIAVQVKQSKQIKYKIFYIDLDKSNIQENEKTEEHFKKTLVFEYSEQDVEKRPLISMHVRGSSRKDQNINTMQVIFFLHQGKIFLWIDNKEQARPILLSETVSTKLYVQNPNIFFFLDKKTNKEGQRDEKDAQIISQEIKKVHVQFNSYMISTVFKANNEQVNIIQFNLDVPEEKLIILSEPKMVIKDSNNTKTNKKFSIYDLKLNKTVYDVPITQEQVIGRLMSGIFQVSNGHIYFSNNVIKIRYDLIYSSDNNQYNQKQIFDDYYNILQIDQEAQIKSETPLVSLRCHRFAYMIANKHKFSTKLLLFLPYPHERRIHLNRKKVNTDYFYTAIQTLYKEEMEYHNTILKHNHTLKKQVTGRGDQEENNNVLQSFKDKKTVQDLRRKSISKTQKEQFSSIVCINQTEQKFYVYSLNGLLFHRVDFNKQVLEYGLPIATSMNGQNFIFKKPRDKIQLGDGDKWKGKDTKEYVKKEQLLTFNLMTLSAYGFSHVKEINLSTIMTQYLTEHKILLQGGRLSKKQKQTQAKNEKITNMQEWIEKANFDTLTDDHFSFSINDALDVCIQIRQSILQDIRQTKAQGPDAENNKDNKGNKGFYYFEKGTHGLREKNGTQNQDEVTYVDDGLQNKDLPLTTKMIIDQLNQQNYSPPARSFFSSCCAEREREIAQKFLILENHSHMKFEMNNKYLFFYDEQKIEYIDFRHDELLLQKDIKDIDFDTDEIHGNSKIKGICVGSNANEICIVVGHPSDNDSLFQWNMEKNTEIEAFDAGKGYQIIWDRQGKMIIINDEKSVLTNEKCSVKVYDYQKKLSEMIENKGQEGFSLSKGHRFDDVNHNWMILGEYISLGFSYMTFVIKDEIEKKNKDLIGNFFDIEPYNYVRNKSTSFLDGSFVKNNYRELKSVLKNMKKLNPNYIDLITYPQNAKNSLSDESGSKFKSQINTVLKMAIDEDNTRNIDLILQYMSMIQFNSTMNFISLFPRLIEYQSFSTYLMNLPKQTRQLSDKQNEQVGTTFDPQILYVSNSSNIYINRGFFNKEKGLDSISSQVVAMRVDMFLDKKHGLQFLSQVLNTQNLDMYNIQSLQMIIQFIYQKIRLVLFSFLVPIYIGQLVSFEYTWRTFEEYMALIDVHLSKEPDHQGHNTTQIHLLRRRLTLSTLSNAFFWLVQVFFNIRMLYYMKFNFFFRYVSWLDIIFALTNLLLIFMVAINIQAFRSETSYEASQLTSSGTDLGGESTGTDRDALHKATRIAEMVGLLIIWTKLTYFLSLFKEVAPLIDMIGKIVYDMLWFVVVFVLFGLGFSLAFYIIAQNQIQFDGVAQSKIPYSVLDQSVEYIFMMVIGGSDHSEFAFHADAKKPSQEEVLWLLFVSSTLVLFIILLPMLIAIMGNSFNIRNERTNEIRIRNELNFVVDNWHLLGLSFGNKNDIKYVLTPFKLDDGDEQFEQLQNLKETIYRVQENQNEIKGALKFVDQHIQKKDKKKKKA